MITKIIKRNGLEEDFNPEKIFHAIKKAWVTVFDWNEDAEETVVAIVHKVLVDIHDLNSPHVPISVIQNFVENRLLDFGKIKVAEQYIEYRIQQDIERYGYGDFVETKLSLNKVR